MAGDDDAPSIRPQQSDCERHTAGPSLHADEFDVLVRDLVPRIRLLLPDLSETEVLRSAARTADYRLANERTLVGNLLEPRG